MSKKSASKSGKDGSVPMFHATVAYKEWVRTQMDRLGFTLVQTVTRMKRYGVEISDSALSQFLYDTKQQATVPSNTHIMPALNKVLGAPPPIVFDPDSPLALLIARVVELWDQLTDRERRMLIEATRKDGEPANWLESLSNKVG